MNNKDKPKSTQPDTSNLQAETEKRLSKFLKHNTSCTILAHSGTERSFCVIRKPWGDNSIGLLGPYLSGSDDNYILALNNIILVERLSAIYHRDKREIEVIWTSFKRKDYQDQIVGREFLFELHGIIHRCRYAESSDRLLIIATNSIFYGDTETNYRNMESFKLYTKPNKSKSDLDRLSTPTSLFIDNIEFDQDSVVNLVHHLNFYIRYFDSLAPVIEIHESESITTSAHRSRYVDGSFPDNINARSLNPTLTSFWSAANLESDSARKFLYYYRLIEYVSFFHLDDTIRSNVKRTLSGPNTAGNIQHITEKVIELIRDSRGDEFNRFKSTIFDLVDQKHILREAKLNTSYFSQEVSFDGGFVMKALLVDPKAGGLGSHGMDNFVVTLRDIRNALSHGRDQKTGQVILPTGGNLKKLQPWVNLIATAAAEVVLYEGLS